MSSDQVAYNTAEGAIPFSPEIEEACLGAILTNPNSYAVAAQHINQHDFFLLRHQWIWEAIARIIQRGLEFDFLTVGEELKDTGHLDEIGGIPYLMRLVNNTPTSVHTEIYALLIKEDSTRRNLLKAADEIKAVALNKELELDRVREEAQAHIQGAVGKSSRRRSRTLQELQLELLDEIEQRIEARANGKPISGISSGWKSLDQITYGALPGQLWYFAGRPGSGKTTLMTCAAMNAAKQGKHVWGWFGEQTALDIMRRVQAREAKASRVQVRDMLAGTVTPEQYSELLMTVQPLQNVPMIVDDTAHITLAEMRAELLALKIRGKLDLIVVDRIELMSVPGLDNKGKEVNRIGALSQGLKSIAREMDVPIYCAVQVNRGVEQRADKRPILSDLRDSGTLEQDGDIVMFTYRDELYDENTTMPNLMEVIVRKHKDGGIGTAGLYFDKPAFDLLEARFEEIDLADRVQFNKDRAPLHYGGNDD